MHVLMQVLISGGSHICLNIYLGQCALFHFCMQYLSKNNVFDCQWKF